MELWIRTQDKDALRKINTGLYLREDLSDYAKGNVWFIVSSGDKLGEYKTKERALEVLDEIQRILHPTVFMSAEINTDDNNWVENGIIYQKYKDNFNIQELSTYVYEMPND